MFNRSVLDCGRCQAFCCKMAGAVIVTEAEIKVMADHFGLSVKDFKKKHLKRSKTKGIKQIKSAYQSCQFLKPNRKCGIYDVRPSPCRGYVCWEEEDKVIYKYAAFAQLPLSELQRLERADSRDESLEY